ncbi:MAG: FAD-dependent oxidoreductase [Candidatus Binatia bacterium]
MERAMNTRLTRLELPGGHLKPFVLDFESPGGGRAPVSAWTVIDTTGDANAATLLGAPTESAEPEDLQHPSYIFRVENVETGILDSMERARTTTVAAREARRGELGVNCSSIVLRPSVRARSVFVTMNLPKPDPAAFDPLDGDAMAELREHAAADADELLRFLARERPAFRSARDAAHPPRVGIRETRRVRGLERLSADAVLSGRRRDDEVCQTTWPIELWSSHERMVFRHAAGAASIPLGCLIADHPSGRLAVAGRCASATHEALGALRVIGTSMAMGEAAGVACALVAKPALTLPTIDAARIRHAVRSGKTTAGL